MIPQKSAQRAITAIIVAWPDQLIIGRMNNGGRGSVEMAKVCYAMHAIDHDKASHHKNNKSKRAIKLCARKLRARKLRASKTGHF
jgi:hypothetical protein